MWGFSLHYFFTFRFFLGTTVIFYRVCRTYKLPRRKYQDRIRTVGNRYLPGGALAAGCQLSWGLMTEFDQYGEGLQYQQHQVQGKTKTSEKREGRGGVGKLPRQAGIQVAVVVVMVGALCCVPLSVHENHLHPRVVARRNAGNTLGGVPRLGFWSPPRIAREVKTVQPYRPMERKPQSAGKTPVRGILVEKCCLNTFLMNFRVSSVAPPSTLLFFQLAKYQKSCQWSGCLLVGFHSIQLLGPSSSPTPRFHS